MPMVRSSDNLLGWFATLLVLLAYLASASAQATVDLPSVDPWGLPDAYFVDSYHAVWNMRYADLPNLADGFYCRVFFNILSSVLIIVAANAQENLGAFSVLSFACALIDALVGGWASSSVVFLGATMLAWATSNRTSAPSGEKHDLKDWDNRTRSVDFVFRLVAAPWLIALHFVGGLVFCIVVMYLIYSKKNTYACVRGVLPGVFVLLGLMINWVRGIHTAEITSDVNESLVVSPAPGDKDTDTQQEQGGLPNPFRNIKPNRHFSIVSAEDPSPEKRCSVM